MKVSYKGIKNDLPAKSQEKIDAKFAKLSKIVDGRGEKQAHVVVSSERHLHKAEITLHLHNHQLVGIGSDGDVFNAISAALDRIEKQAVKEGARWRATTRRAEPMKAVAAKAASPPAPKQAPVNRAASSRISLRKGGSVPTEPGASDRRVFRPNQHERRKPITLEEALMEMEDGRDYVAYRDADKQVVAILIRRRDGHYDLIES